MASIIKIIFENILESLFCSIFVLNTKRNSKTKNKILYIFLCMIFYLLLKSFLKFNILFQVLYMIGCYSISIITFKKESNILDLIMIIGSYLFLIVESIITYFPLCFIFKYLTTLILSRIILFISFYLLRNKLYNIYLFLIKSWNRKTNKTKMKSLTVRNICIIGMNLIFLIIFIWLSYT